MFFLSSTPIQHEPSVGQHILDGAYFGKKKAAHWDPSGRLPMVPAHRHLPRELLAKFTPIGLGKVTLGKFEARYPLVICYIAIENGPFITLIVDLPINSMVIFHSYVGLPEGMEN